MSAGDPLTVVAHGVVELDEFWVARIFGALGTVDMSVRTSVPKTKMLGKLFQSGQVQGLNAHNILHSARRACCH